MITKLTPAYKDYLWGGIKLKEHYGKVFDGDILAESWELSCHPDGESIIASGASAGMSLSAWLAKNPDGMGTNGAKYDGFPILIKFIDAKQDLSIQVHPDDDYAQKYEGDNGKNEMWYIAEADDDAFIYYGFKHNITKEEYAQRISDNTLLDVLHRVDVKKGDCFFIEAGTVHAIGAGCLIAEVQQSSNVTYRVYDYARRGVDGKLRELHIEKAQEVSTLAPANNTVADEQKLVDCKYFAVEDIKVSGEREFVANERTFHSILVLSGTGTMVCGDETLELAKGESIFVSAASGSYKLSGDFHALLTYMSDKV